MKAAADDPEFLALTRLISARAGLALDAYKDKCLRRRIAVRMRACGVHTYDEYQQVLEATPAEYDHLKDALTINVTRFYRNPETWDLLRNRVLPELLARRHGAVHMWSAGCASGEEPYTLAMLCLEAAARAGHPAWADRILIDATDIDRVSLERAAAGRYREASIVDLPSELAARYTRAAGGDIEVADSLRRLVRFGRLDFALERPRQPQYDLILCRNVVIYFDRPMQERLFVTFADTLTPGGYLVLGKVETLFGPARDSLTLVDPRERVYRRPA